MKQSNAAQVMDLKEFRDVGFLQELNRTFLHPMGLSMELVETPHAPFDEAGRPANITYTLEVLDSRWDPLGVSADDAMLSADKVDNVRREFMRHFHDRMILFQGSHIQPVPGYDPRELPQLPGALTPEGAE